MREHEEKSRGQATAQQVALNISGGLPETDDRPKWSGRHGEGKVLGWLATYTDIEDRKRAEEELRRNAALLEQAEGLTRAGSFEWNVFISAAG